MLTANDVRGNEVESTPAEVSDSQRHTAQHVIPRTTDIPATAPPQKKVTLSADVPYADSTPPDAEQRLRQAARILANGAIRAALKRREKPLPSDVINPDIT